MSHFTVLVIGENPEKQLAPFHEFECTGWNNQYVIDVDITAEARKDWSEDTTYRLRAPDGTLVDPYDEMYYRDPTFDAAERLKSDPLGLRNDDKEFKELRRMVYSKDWEDGRGYRPRIRFIPDGFEETQIRTGELESFTAWATNYYSYKSVNGNGPDPTDDHKYGYICLDANGEVERIVKRTNPNSKWDWYQIGGRWSGFFRLKDGRSGDLGERSLLDQRPDDRQGCADQARKADIDFEAMRYEKRYRAIEIADKYDAVIAQFPDLRSWKSVREEFGDERIDEARKFYRSQPGQQELNEAMPPVLGCWVEEFAQGREAYIQSCEDSAFQTYAVLKDGVWCARGEMGWFGMSDDKLDPDEWNKQFLQMIDELPDDAMLTIVDCHT